MLACFISVISFALFCGSEIMRNELRGTVAGFLLEGEMDANLIPDSVAHAAACEDDKCLISICGKAV